MDMKFQWLCATPLSRNNMRIALISKHLQKPLKRSLHHNSQNRSRLAMNFRTGTERGQPCPRVPYPGRVTMDKRGPMLRGSYLFLLAEISED
jgi:hypothetical protein